jgi:hypothetical protein
MKKIIYLFLVFFLMGCTLPTIQQCKLNVLVEEIHEKIEYKSDGKGKDFWQYPEETATLRTGDCEDMAILFISIAYNQYEITPKLLLTVSSTGNGHASVLYEGTVYDPTWNKVFPVEELEEMGYKIISEVEFVFIPLCIVFKRSK